MRRIIDHFLHAWKHDNQRKPLLIRGARQVGKTYSVRQLGQSYAEFVEINFEAQPAARLLFEKDMDAQRIIRELSLLSRKRIIPGKTLLFFDEVQAEPQVITALRYFYEQVPQLHVIAAGSLLDFAIEQVGIPVGRVQSLYMYPVSFLEYLSATGEQLLVHEILQHRIEQGMAEVIHARLLGLLGEYLAVGGMPQTVAQWAYKKDALGLARSHADLLDAYRQDFGKYARTLQVKYVEAVFNHLPLQIGRKFKYSLIEGDYRKRELAPALDLLVTAGVATKVHFSAAQGIPLGAQVDVQDYKLLFLDVGLTQAALGLDIADWFINLGMAFINKGQLVEALVGQELLAYAPPYQKAALYYWHKEGNAQQAEIDYLIQLGGSVVPVEVKAGTGRTLRSLQTFLQTHAASSYGIRLSTHNYSVHQAVHSYPLYALAGIVAQSSTEMREALHTLGAGE